MCAKVDGVNSPFESFHRTAGAVLRPVEGAEYPIRYAHPFAEHNAVRAKAGLFDVSFLGKLEVSGVDARDFVQRIVSADLRGTASGCGTPTYLLSAQGKILHSFDAYATPDGFLFISEGSDIGNLIADLEKLRFNDRVQYRDFTGDLGALLLAGPAAERILTDAAGDSALPPAGERNHGFVTIEGSRVLVARDRRTGSEGFLLFIVRGAAARVWDALQRAGKPHGMVPAGLAAFDSLRIEAGTPRFGLDYFHEHFPQEVGNEAAFSLNKGCYPGQETVARIDTYGKVHRRLVGLVFDSPNEDLPQSGDRLSLADAEVGEVKSWAISPALERPIGFGIVRTAKAPAGATLDVREGNRVLTAKVVEPPFVKL
jgi:folate-binding protein YgfZ